MSISKNIPQNYFDTLLESNILKSIKFEAINKIEKMASGFIENVDYEKGVIEYWIATYNQATDDSIDVLKTYSFVKEFPKEVHKEAEKLRAYIDNTVLEINKNGNNANQFLISQVKYLNTLTEKSKTVYPKLAFIEASIQNIITYLVDRYSLKGSYKKQSLNINTIFSYFDIKSGIKLSLLEQLYDTCVDLEIIDDEILSEETFINVLTSNPIASNEAIIFKCNNQLIAHFINCIQPLFYNLTVSQISKSKSFVNKKEKVLNQADLDNANKRLREKSSSQIDRITTHISRILNS